RDGDTIHAVIKGSAIGHDGKTNGIGAPNPAAQTDVIVRALTAAKVHPETISYVEAHGTGTALGDPIEIQGLSQAYRQFTDRRGFCGIGSVKTNIGHLESAAGIASLIKVILSLNHRLLPPSLHSHVINPLISFPETPFYLVRDLRQWEGVNHRLRAGLSSFGFGGVNAHIIVEEPPPSAEPTEPARPRELLTLSARTQPAVKQLVATLDRTLSERDGASLADLCYTLTTRRAHLG